MKRAILMIILTGTGLLGAESSEPWSLEILPGENYIHTKWFGIIPVKLTPQIAVWAETERGEYIETLYITEQSARNRWKGAESRPEALPVYFHLSRPEQNGSVDAVSAATSREGVDKWSVSFPSSGTPLVIKAEVNASFDYNSRYAKKNSGVNGQPSLIYSGLWTGTENTIILTAVGTGDLTGQGGTISEDLSGLTTAFTILREIKLKKE